MKARFAIVAAVTSLLLVGGLVHLHGIFVQERDDALAAVDSRRQALVELASKELSQRLRDRLARERRTIEAAATDPLVPAESLLLLDGGQILPRTVSTRAGPALAPALWQGLAADPARLARLARERDPDAPWARRLDLLVELEGRVADGDRSAIEAAVRRILAHRGAYLVAASHDIPFTLALLSRLERVGVSPDLARALLRDGLEGRYSRLQGLQRSLLSQRGALSLADFEYLARAVSAASERLGVLHGDFDKRVAEPAASTVSLGAVLEPTLLSAEPGGSWYVEPPRRGRTYGLAVDVVKLAQEVTSSMRERSLLGPEGTVLVAPPHRSAVSKLPLTVASPRFAPMVSAAHRRYRLKAAVEGVVALLVFGVLGLGAAIQRREARFVELKGDFVSAVSHELRTPLASIRLMAETLERRTRDVPGVRDYPTRIVRDVDSLAFLVENILSFNRLARGRWQPHKSEVRLSDIVDKLASEPSLWARRPAELTGEGLEQAVLHADADLVQLCLVNLVRNASQYTERTPALIHVSAEPDERGWRVHVRDNGVGIPEQEQARVFDDFYRSNDKGERGSGLGLAICRKVMEAHGGTIVVAESSPDGTTFELIFPLQG